MQVINFGQQSSSVQVAPDRPNFLTEETTMTFDDWLLSFPEDERDLLTLTEAWEAARTSELAAINYNILARVREIFMLREYMVHAGATAAMSDAIREPAQQLYLHDTKFHSLVDGLTAGFMRLFTEYTFPVPPDKVTVFAPAGKASAVRDAFLTPNGLKFKCIYETPRNGGVLMGFE